MEPTVTLDVRPILARGTEPLAEILAAVDALSRGQTLRLIAPFRPVPLFRVMARRGYDHHETRLPDKGWQIDFAPAAHRLGQGSALDAFGWPEPTALLDLSAQSSDEAAERLRQALGRIPPGDVVFALLAAEPADLLAELGAQGHKWAGNPAADGSGFRLLLRRAD
ncbi:DUF2249 domain-containing protein [Paracoccus yeei]|uniref:DUF2249 domain-containing protein n=1 Tax=Paracoccus yeei TaxID=147645 RepID=UPI001C8E103C|nr:DUF2249 domain-containing protein [Paracoccus yeei]MBY0134868.1 DUF2249 domain-containing protein [Paracoccus yeei]